MAERAWKPWTPEEHAYLVANLHKLSSREIGAHLERKPHAVRNRAYVFKLTKNTEWTDDDIARLRTWYESKANLKFIDLNEAAEMLGRSRAGVALKASKLGLTNLARKGPPKVRVNKYATEEERRAANSARVKLLWKTRPHPRGALGLKPKPEHLAKMKEGSARWHRETPVEIKRKIYEAGMAKRIAKYGSVVPHKNGGENLYSRCASGRRPDLDNRFFRSRWEANYARFLNFLKAQGQIEKWEYETETFWFEKIKRGVRSYKPDFKVWEPNGHVYFVEVKGWMDAKSQTKLKRMKKYHPKVDLRLVGDKAYYEIQRKLGGAIPGWERRPQ